MELIENLDTHTWAHISKLYQYRYNAYSNRDCYMWAGLGDEKSAMHSCPWISQRQVRVGCCVVLIGFHQSSHGTCFTDGARLGLSSLRKV